MTAKEFINYVKGLTDIEVSRIKELDNFVGVKPEQQVKEFYNG